MARKIKLMQMNNNIIHVSETQTSVRIFCAGKLPLIIEDWHISIIKSLKDNIKKIKDEITDNDNSRVD
jgi:hypothetical protein